MENLIRVRVWEYDYNGGKTNRDYVCYVETLEEAERLGWKYELA